MSEATTLDMPRIERTEAVQPDALENQALADTINMRGYPEITAAQVAEIRFMYSQQMRGRDLPLAQNDAINAVIAMRAMVRSHSEDFDD